MDANTRDAVRGTGPALETLLRALEEDLLRPEVRRSPAELEARLAPDFVEFGRSGRIHDRAAIVAALRDEAPAEVVIADFAVRLLAPDIALATYRTRAAGPGGSVVVALRSSICRRDDIRRRLVFHQGTPAS